MSWMRLSPLFVRQGEMFRRVIVLSVVILFTVSLGYAACPVGYVQGLTPESCYKLINYTVGWSPAEWHCIREGGHLTSVGSAFENNFLRKLAASFNADRFWIGAGSSGPDLWHWNDKSQWTYTNWAPGMWSGKYLVPIHDVTYAISPKIQKRIRRS